ncbi:NeuD/PglB/VioB family sugar acetyltransferase [Brevundimonas sp.]|uniref:NeuD/PglB/VioB family sugar acetyltransferase n=1 Tax=Brevundimonas sp. TaxID=1871086 RepID=UPI001A2A2466|nr:NeuD/PglB/VioB family sugar acetyltransferase [Brevundimonas sp.]MBJ7485600.1 NeuD/PglB/VioB family sugar acetyltransferase [Brevundimonas sp.]
MPTPAADSRPITLIGAGGQARVAAACARRAGLVIGAVLDAAPDRIGQVVGGIEVTADDQRGDSLFHLAIGSNRTRRELAFARHGADWATIVDPDASMADDVVCDVGTLIGMGARVQTGARLGCHVIVNTGAVVEHDCLVGDFSHIAPGAVLTGAVQAGEGVLVGAGAVVLPGLTLGDWSVVGAGAVVTRSVEAGATVVGNPAGRMEPRQ